MTRKYSRTFDKSLRNTILRAKTADALAGWFLGFCADATKDGSLAAMREERERRPRAQAMPSCAEAIAVPSTRALIFWNAMSRAISGEPCLGFTSMLNGEKPQSSVAPSRSLGMYLAAVTRSSHTCSGVSTIGLSGLMTPMKQTCGTPFASSRLCSPINL